MHFRFGGGGFVFRLDTCQRRPTPCPNPKSSNAFPCLSLGTREAFSELALTTRGLLRRTPTLAYALLGASALAVLAPGLAQDVPMAGPVSPSLRSKATSSRKPSLATRVKGGGGPSPESLPITVPSGHDCWPPAPTPGALCYRDLGALPTGHLQVDGSRPLCGAGTWSGLGHP